MPDPNRLLVTLRRAVQAVRGQTGRHGRVLHLDLAAEVLVAGDLHGNLENFKRLLDRAQLAGHPARHLVLQEIIHGPFHYPDGRDKSHQLVDLLAALTCQFPHQVHLLLGNHELAQWTGQRIGKGDEDCNDLFRLGVATAYQARAEDIYAGYLELFAACPFAIRTANRVFLSHSLPSSKRLDQFDLAVLTRDEQSDADLRWGGSVHSLLWGRDPSPANVAAFLQKVDADWLITGHIPCERGFDAPNERQIILDAGSAPACYCLFPADRPVTQHDLLEGVGIL